MAFLLVLLAVFAPGASGQLQPEDWAWHRAVSSGRTVEPVTGLLDLPDVVGGGCGPAQPTSARLYTTTSSVSRAVGSITLAVTGRQPDGGSCDTAELVVTRAGATTSEPLPTDESAYEVPAAVVYERSGSWFRIALQHGTAWIQRGSMADFHQYPELLDERLAYLREHWDGMLRAEPGASKASRLSSGWQKHLAREIPVDVLEVRRIGPHAWVHLRLRTETCGQSIDGVQPVTGWVPAQRATGQPTLWFYPRGC